MSEQTPDSPPAGAARPAVTVDPAILDRYAGHYQLGDYSVCNVTRREGCLFMQADPFPPGELLPESETEFIGATSRAHYFFLADDHGAITGIRMQSIGPDIILPRLDEVACEEVRNRLAARIEANVPVPGSEAALRRLIEGLLEGCPDYDEMSPGLAHALRKELPRFQTLARYLGAIHRIEFKGVGRRGWDIYDVHRENGVAQWRIAFKDGIIVGATASLADGP